MAIVTQEKPGNYLKITKAIVDSDIDGVVCAAMLCCIFGELQITLAEPRDVQAGLYNNVVDSNTVIADLGFVDGCGLYFDHHLSNKPKNDNKIAGRWKSSPSAARIIFDYFRLDFDLKKYKEIVDFVDSFDSGKVCMEEIENPNELMSLGFAITRKDKIFAMKVLRTLAKMKTLKNFFAQKFIVNRLELYRKYLQEYKKYIETHTEIIENIAFIDNREFTKDVTHSYFTNILFPDTKVAVSIKRDKNDAKIIILSLYRNSFCKKPTKYNLLDIVKQINPKNFGGHSYACGVTLPKRMSLEQAKKIILEMFKKD